MVPSDASGLPTTVCQFLQLACADWPDDKVSFLVPCGMWGIRNTPANEKPPGNRGLSAFLDISGSIVVHISKNQSHIEVL